jgi:hypothetical protein
MSKRQKTLSGGGGAMGNFIITKQATQPKCIGTKIACLDDVYHERDRDENIRGHHYIYRCTEVKQSARGIRYVCVFLNERIKANCPKAVTVTHRDDTDLDAQEVQEFDQKTFEASRSRYKDHVIRMNNLKKQELAEKAAAAIDASSGGKSEELIIFSSG